MKEKKTQKQNLDTKRKKACVAFNICKADSIWRLLITASSLWFLEFITSFVYAMINTLVLLVDVHLSSCETWLLKKKQRTKKFIMRSKKNTWKEGYYYQFH